MLFTPGHKLYSAELVRVEATLTKTILKDGETLPLQNQLPSRSLPLIEVLDTLVSTPQRLHEYESNAACQASKRNLPNDFPTSANDKLFVVYQDWVHQNSGTHLDGDIEEDGKWQKFVFPPYVMKYPLAR